MPFLPATKVSQSTGHHTFQIKRRMEPQDTLASAYAAQTRHSPNAIAHSGAVLSHSGRLSCSQNCLHHADAISLLSLCNAVGSQAFL